MPSIIELKVWPCQSLLVRTVKRNHHRILAYNPFIGVPTSADVVITGLEVPGIKLGAVTLNSQELPPLYYPHRFAPSWGVLLIRRTLDEPRTLDPKRQTLDKNPPTTQSSKPQTLRINLDPGKR